MKDFMFMDDKYRSIRHFEAIYWYMKYLGQPKKVAAYMNLSVTHTNRLLTEFQDDNALDNRENLAYHCGRHGRGFWQAMVRFLNAHKKDLDEARELSTKRSRSHRNGARHV